MNEHVCRMTKKYAYFWLLTSVTNLRFLVHHANRDDGETQACCDTEFAQAQRLDAKLHTQRYKDIYSGFVVALFGCRCHKHLRRICSRRPRTGGCSTVRKPQVRRGLMSKRVEKTDFGQQHAAHTNCRAFTFASWINN